MTDKAQIYIADFIDDELAPEREILGDLASVEAINARNEAQLEGRIDDAQAVMLYHELSLTHKTINRLHQCKLIVRCGVGVDNVDLRAARDKGIAVANIPDYGTEEVADSALAMALTLMRGVHYLNARLRAGQGAWHFTQVAPLERIRQRVFGIVGLGRIGTAAALRAKAHGMRVMFFDPYKPDGYDKALGVERCDSLSELLQQAHVLSLHCPLTDETRHIIDEAAIRTMPKGGYLVNTARGAVVDTSILPNLIEQGQLKGVGLDVLATEPPSTDDPLIAAWQDPRHPAHHRLIINPHSAFYCEQGLMEMRVKGAKACRQALLNQPIANVVNT